jgi:hypothetical protein
MRDGSARPNAPQHGRWRQRGWRGRSLAGDQAAFDAEQRELSASHAERHLVDASGELSNDRIQISYVRSADTCNLISND